MISAMRLRFAAISVTVIFLVGCASGAAAQTAPAAQGLYRALRTLTLDPERAYGVRDATLEREDLHLSLDDGVIAFSRAVDGRITGAFFVGEGEILLIPPNRVERISLGLFTGSAILEEKFTSAYFRFNDDVLGELQPGLRPTEDAQSFVTRWSSTVETLADTDALRLLNSFLSPANSKLNDHFLRARLGGTRHGTIDVFVDSTAPEQISVRQLQYNNGIGYYNIWTSFAMRSARQAAPTGEIKDASEYLGISGYHIKSRVRPPTELETEAQLTLEVGEGAGRVIFFELSRYLKLSTVTADGKPLEFLQNEALEGSQLSRRGDDLVAVIFPEPLVAGRKLELRFTYSGSVLSEAGGGLMYVGARGAWYPHRGPAMSNFDLEFRYPAKWTLLATGNRVSLDTSGDEYVAHWVTERPIPLAGFNLGQYSRSESKAGAVSVESYAGHSMEAEFPKSRPTIVMRQTPPGSSPVTPLVTVPLSPNPASYGEQVAHNSAKVIEFLAARLGPFPYKSLALTQMPGGSSQGWPGLVFLSSYAYETPEQLAQSRLSRGNILMFANVMQAHETAHQWWGDLVLWRSYRDQWLVEALSNYCALLMVEKDNPAIFREIMDEYRRNLLEKDKNGDLVANAGPVALGVRLSSSRFPEGFDAISYGRGTWLFHMLRYLVREPAHARGKDPDDAFFQALRRLLERFAGKSMSTDDVQRAFEEVLPPSAQFEGRKSLDWFFDSWVNGIALPRLQFEELKFTRRAAATVVTGKLLQKDAPPDLITAVPVYASMAGKAPVFVATLFADGAETSFHLTVPPATRKLLIDPFQTVLTRP